MSGFSLAEYFDRQEMRNVRAKIGLIGHLDRRPSRRYFALWLQAPKIAARGAYLGKFDFTYRQAQPTKSYDFTLKLQ